MDIVKKNNGLIVGYDDPNEYAEAIISLLSNRDKIKSMEKITAKNSHKFSRSRNC